VHFIENDVFSLRVYTVIRNDDGSGPAVTVDVENTMNTISHSILFSVDVVPGVRLLEWPDPAKFWRSFWLLPEDVSKYKKPDYHDAVKPFVVPKIHPTGTHFYCV